MWKLVSLILLPLLLISEELEVRLNTRSSLTPIYLSHFSEELRSVLEFDLNASGICSVVPQKEELEETLKEFRPSVWKKEKIPYLLSVREGKENLEVIAYNIEKSSSKRYTVGKDRYSIHKLADAIQKDLFGQEGIASKRLIYTKRVKSPTEKGLSWISEVWMCDSDGENARQLTHDKSYCLSPFFLNQDEYCYVSEKSGQTKIYKGSLSLLKSELMVELKGNQALPSFSRQTQQMAFITDVAGRPDLFIQSFDRFGKMAGKARQIFSAPRATQATPTFSPDGKQIAFVSDKDGPPRIYVMNLTSPKQAPRLLTKQNRENTSPSWSPDGKKLAYSAKVDGIRQIWIYDFVTGEETALTTNPENKENPSWAPDSFHLVYNTENENTCELYLVHLNGVDPIKISKGPGEKRFASWEIQHSLN